MSDIKDKILQESAKAVEERVEQGDVECENCGSQNLSAEVWVDGERLEGNALCNDCNETQPINIQGEKAAQAGDKIQDAIDDLEDALNDF